jgi:hypothetical protein
MSDVLAFIYKKYSSLDDAFTQLTVCLSEHQVQFDLKSSEWWKTQEYKKYPAVAAIAIQIFSDLVCVGKFKEMFFYDMKC